MIKEIIKNFFAKLLYIKAEFTWTRHINKIYRHLGIKKSNLDNGLVIKHQQYWRQLKKKVNPKWLHVYSHITNNPDIHYIPENIYFNIIEGKLNNRQLALAYADKNFYEIYYGYNEVFPETILRNIDGLFYSKEYKLFSMTEEKLSNYLSNYQKFLIKPSIDSGGGKKIQLFFKMNDHFVNTDNESLTSSYLVNNFGNNYIIQNYIQQSSFLEQFNSSSVNTIRIFTYRSVVNDEVMPLHAILRIGKKGNYIDDQNIGGIACRINFNSKLNDYATNYLGEKCYEYNEITFSHVKEIPKVNEMKETAVLLAGKNIHSRVLGFDFTLDINDNVKLIEINHLWTGINFFQMNDSPVLGKYTDEVVQFCKAH